MAVFRVRFFVCVLVVGFLSVGRAGAQGGVSGPLLPSAPVGLPLSKGAVPLRCPGSFATDLTVLDCTYTPQMRYKAWVIGSVTDEAVLRSGLGGLFSQMNGSPSEWPQNWSYYGVRVGTSYAGSLGRSTVEYVVGAIQHDDPRHIRCSDDPRGKHNLDRKVGRAVKAAQAEIDSLEQDPRLSAEEREAKEQVAKEQLFDTLYASNCGPWHRVGHAFFDAFLVRHSLPDGLGIYEPAVGRVLGVYGGVYASYPWEPQSENKFVRVNIRAAESYGFTLADSIWTEFGSSLTSFLFKSRGSKGVNSWPGTASVGGKQ